MSRRCCRLLERLLDLGSERIGIVGAAKRQLQPAAQPADRLLQVVGDIGGRLVDVLDQLLQVRERGIDLRCNVIEVVMRGGHGHALVNLPTADLR